MKVLEEKEGKRRGDMEGLASDCFSILQTLNLSKEQVEEDKEEGNLIINYTMSDEEEEVCPIDVQLELQEHIFQWGDSSDFSFSLHFDTFDSLLTYNEVLKKEKDQRSTLLKRIGGEIQKLWKLLSVPKEDQLGFSSACTQLGLSIHTIRRGEEELERLQIMKREQMAEVVERIRNEISDLWDQLMFGEEQRSEFGLFSKDASDITDEEFEEHQTELTKLKLLVISLTI